MDMNAIRRRNLRAVINEKYDGSPARFSRDTGIEEGRLSQVLSEKYRGGNNFGEKAARNIEEKAGLPKLSLDTIAPSAAEAGYGRLNSVAQKHQEFDLNTVPAAIGRRAIPVISPIQAGALTETSEPYEPGDGYATLYTDDAYSKWAFALEIEGDSMLPEFRAGDFVIIEPEWEPRPGEYVVAKNSKNEATFKKYRQRGLKPDGSIIFDLVPLNPDYPTISSDVTPMQIIGVMAEHRRKSRR